MSADSKAARFSEAAGEREKAIEAWGSAMVGLLASGWLDGPSESTVRLRADVGRLRKEGVALMRTAPATAEEGYAALLQAAKKVHGVLAAGIRNHPRPTSDQANWQKMLRDILHDALEGCRTSMSGCEIDAAVDFVRESVAGTSFEMKPATAEGELVARVETVLDEINEWGHMPPGEDAKDRYTKIEEELRALMQSRPATAEGELVARIRKLPTYDGKGVRNVLKCDSGARFVVSEVLNTTIDLAKCEPRPAADDGLRDRLAKAIKDRDESLADSRKMHSTLMAAVNDLFGFSFISGSPFDSLLDSLRRTTKSMRSGKEEQEREIKRLKADLVIAKDGAKTAAVQVPEHVREWCATFEVGRPMVTSPGRVAHWIRSIDSGASEPAEPSEAKPAASSRLVDRAEDVLVGLDSDGVTPQCREALRQAIDAEKERDEDRVDMVSKSLLVAGEKALSESSELIEQLRSERDELQRQLQGAKAEALSRKKAAEAWEDAAERASGNAKLKQLREDIRHLGNAGIVRGLNNFLQVVEVQDVFRKLDRLLAAPDEGEGEQPQAGDDAPLREVATWTDGRGTALHAAVAELCRRELGRRGGAK